jgi:hypothetical protein
VNNQERIEHNIVKFMDSAVRIRKREYLRHLRQR